MNRRQFLQVTGAMAVYGWVYRFTRQKKPGVPGARGNRADSGVIGCLPLCLETEQTTKRYYFPFVKGN